MKLPNPLFKYVTTSRALQILTDKNIRFTEPANFNDPFEVCPSLDMKRIKSDYLNMWDVKRDTENGEERKETMRRFHQFTKGIVYSLAREYESIGILSLSSRCDTQLMWSHYCSNHTGVVIGFRICEGLLPPILNKQNPEFYADLRPIQYKKERFKFPTNIREGLDYVFVKDSCWSYEKEWRILRGLKTLVKLDNGIHVSPFEPSAVRCVIFGINTSKEDKESIRKLLNRDEYSHVHLYASLLNSDSFGMDITTDIGKIMSDEDNYFEGYDYPDITHFYKLVSKGRLYKAMEIIDENIVFGKEKDSIDFNP
jgi:hypothetical protein